MKTFSAFMALCEGNPPVTGGFPSQRPMRWELWVSLICVKRLSKQLGHGDLRRHCAHYDAIAICNVASGSAVFKWKLGYHWLTRLRQFFKATVTRARRPISQRIFELMIEMSKWRHQMETFSLLLAPLWGEWTSLQRPVTRNFDAFFDLRLNKWLSKQQRRRWFETLSRPLWRKYNVINTTFVSFIIAMMQSAVATWGNMWK